MKINLRLTPLLLVIVGWFLLALYKTLSFLREMPESLELFVWLLIIVATAWWLWDKRK